jgi:hypothetical protein
MRYLSFKTCSFVQTTSRWSPWLDGAECAEESTDASDLQKQPNQWLCQNCATSCLGTRRRRRRRRRITTIQCVQSLGICNLQGISRMEMQRCREKYQMMAQEEHVVAVELEESEASDQTCFVAVAVASLLAVGLAAAAAVAVVAGSPLAASVAAGSVELAEQVPVTAVTGWAWQMSAAAAAAAVELVAVAAVELAAAVVSPVARFVVVTAAAAAMQSCSESEAGYCQMVAAAAELGPAAAVAVVVAVAVEKIVVDAGEGSVDVTSAS